MVLGTLLGLVPPLFLWGLLRIRRVLLPLFLPWALGGSQGLVEPLAHVLLVIVVRRIHADVPPAAGLAVAGRNVPVVLQVVFHDARHLVGPLGTTAVLEALEGVPPLVKPRAKSCCGVKHASGTRCGVPHGSDTCSRSQGVGAWGHALRAKEGAGENPGWRQGSRAQRKRQGGKHPRRKGPHPV